MIREDEQIVLGTWLRGDRLELVDLFDEEDFTSYKRLFRSMQSRHKDGLGFDAIELSKSSGVERITILKLIGMSVMDAYHWTSSILKTQFLIQYFLN